MSCEPVSYSVILGSILNGTPARRRAWPLGHFIAQGSGRNLVLPWRDITPQNGGLSGFRPKFGALFMFSVRQGMFDGVFEGYVPSAEDVAADDWVIVE